MKFFCLCFCGFALLAAARAEIFFEPQEVYGQTFAHDPSSITRDGTNWILFRTGPGVRAKWSSDLKTWREAPAVFTNSPAWISSVVPQRELDFWAPDVVHVGDEFFLYYSVSKWGKQVSAIGLAKRKVNTTEPWRDFGPVIVSTNGDAFNAIDPGAFRDRDGRLWLVFGSYWRGIFLVELDPSTGKRAAERVPPVHLAWNQAIEAPCLTRHGDFYYLFANWGQCCRGTNSTYEVRVGRAEKIGGPYRDRAGNDLAMGGGTPFLQSAGRFIGPGHIGMVDDGSTNGPERFSYHYYDAETRGRPRLALARIDWSNGWPQAVR